MFSACYSKLETIAPAIVGAYKAISANVSGAAGIDALLADADTKWAQISANADAAIAADKPTA